MANLIKKIFDIILVLIIVALSSYFALRCFNIIKIYIVKTGSMKDNIHIGDYIFIVNKSKYNVGDVVTYKDNDGFITHRIIAKNGNKITTKGDANNVEDEKIDESAIVGKVILSGGILNIIINYKYTIAGLLLLLYLFSCYLYKEKNKNQE